jgi:hypothetical protein
MQFKSILVAAAAFACASALNITNTVVNNVTAGEPFTITWGGAKGPVTINLKNGPALNLKTFGPPIGSGLSGGSFTWNVPSTLPADTYAFEITDGETTNYSAQFQLIGGASASASATASSNSTSTASSSSKVTDASNSTTTRTSSRASNTASRTGSETTDSSATGTPTSAPSGGMAAGLTSNLAFVFLAVGALMTLN